MKIAKSNHLFSVKKKDDSAMYAERRMWNDLRLPQEVLESSPECVETLLKAHTAHYIVLFSRGQIDETIKLDSDLHPRVLMQGRWERWEVISKEIVYDEMSECFVSRNDPETSWNYVQDLGFIPKESAAKTLYPVATLKVDEHEELKKRATSFWQSHPEVDQGKKKEYTLQLVTTRTHDWEQNWFTEGYQELAPRHVTLRLIDKNAKLYSFGLEIDQRFRAFIAASPWSIFTSGKSFVTTPDFCETWHFTKRLTTSIPITKERFEAIVEHVEKINNSNGQRFCQMQQNCLSFATKVAEIAGVVIDTKMTLPEVACSAIPRKIVSFFDALIPAIVKNAFHKITLLVNRVCVGLFMVMFGAHKSVPLSNEPPLFSSWFDFFDGSLHKVDHVYKLLQWQKMHSGATKTFFYLGAPQLCV